MNVVAAGLADRFELQLAYVIGYARPISLNVETFGTGTVSDETIRKLIEEHFDFRPGPIIERFGLRRPIYRQTATYGHFGRPELPWEKIDLAETLANAAGAPGGDRHFPFRSHRRLRGGADGGISDRLARHADRVLRPADPLARRAPRLRRRQRAPRRRGREQPRRARARSGRSERRGPRRGADVRRAHRFPGGDLRRLGRGRPRTRARRRAGRRGGAGDLAARHVRDSAHQRDASWPCGPTCRARAAPTRFVRAEGRRARRRGAAGDKAVARRHGDRAPLAP